MRIVYTAGRGNRQINLDKVAYFEEKTTSHGSTVHACYTENGDHLGDIYDSTLNNENAGVFPNTTKVKILLEFYYHDGDVHLEYLPIIGWKYEMGIAVPVTIDEKCNSSVYMILLESGKVVYPFDSTYESITAARRAMKTYFKDREKAQKDVSKTK